MSSVFGLKVTPRTAIFLASYASASGVDEAHGHGDLTLGVSGLHLFDQGDRATNFARGAHDCVDAPTSPADP